MYKVETQADIFDFKKRYVRVEKNVEEANQLLNKKMEEYRRLKKLQYNTSLAQMMCAIATAQNIRLKMILAEMMK